ncbi:Hypothetical_protein [Hexamita inflata]|uniref:Hypothetical_protein n=1 Tax=Hexamita inflata TaxID=28002 RepID=A0AA86U3T8_9EUKA|nr:Hypothetical protein HINF_LOCUS24572 [Hexamita inflata]
METSHFDTTVNMQPLNQAQISCESVPHASVLLYSGSLFFKCIQHCNLVPNPLKITHSGLVIHISGSELMSYLTTGQFVNVKPQAVKKIKDAIYYDDDVIRPYTIEACYPYVLIAPVDKIVAKYEGSIYIRRPIFQHQIIWKDLIGLPFKLNLKQMLLAGWELNKHEDSSSLFCSELVSLIINRSGAIKVISTNILPKLLVSTSKEKDILQGVFQKECLLKK